MASFKKTRIAILTAAALTIPSISYAQQDGPIEEIVVTSTKRAKTLQEVPIAVSVTTAETIEKAQIQDLSDLQSIVPSLRIDQLQNSTNTNFRIRGFGNGANNPGIEPSVGVFIDGVYRSRSAAAISDLPSLERVEVLRGPQSTLFGKNASAGVISVVTKKPTGEYGGKVSASIGNYSALVLKGEVTGALSDNAAYSLYASHNSRDGYVTNEVTGNDLNNRNRNAFRGQLVYTPSDDTEFRFIADYDKIDEECCAAVNILEGPLGGFAIPAVGGRIVPNDREATSVFYNIDTSNEIENSGISMQIDKEYESVALTSITSVRKVDSFSIIDADFTSAAVITNPISTEIDTFTQEIRIASTDGDKLDWMVGGFYFDESIDYANNLDFGANYRGYFDAITAASGAPGAIGAIEGALGLPVGQVFGREGAGPVEEGSLENDSFSIFANLDWHLSDQLTATLGLNYTKDEKQAEYRQLRNDEFSSVDLEFLGFASIFAQLTGLPPTPQNFALAPQAVAVARSLAQNPQVNRLLALQPIQFLPPFVDYPNAVEDGKSDDDQLTYTLRLNYEISDNLSIYGGVSTGFKATSWNLSRDARPFDRDVQALRTAGLATPNLSRGTRFASPEESTVYELGLKARFESGAFNLAIFDQSIKGFQSNSFLGTGFSLTNAGEQSAKGIEFDLTYYPTDSLQLTLAGTFMDPVYDSFENAFFVNNQPVSYTGQKPAEVNEASVSASATYRWQVRNGVEAFIRTDYLYEDKTGTDNAIPIEIASREVRNLNATLGFTTDNGLSMSLWGRNLTDHVTLISAFPSVAQAGSFSGYRTFPRTFGVNVSKEF